MEKHTRWIITEILVQAKEVIAHLYFPMFKFSVWVMISDKKQTFP
jgi:hypothetical protein